MTALVEAIQLSAVTTEYPLSAAFFANAHQPKLVAYSGAIKITNPPRTAVCAAWAHICITCRGFGNFSYARWHRKNIRNQQKKVLNPFKLRIESNHNYFLFVGGFCSNQRKASRAVRQAQPGPQQFCSQLRKTAMEKFSSSEKGLTRFPPNIEQITVEHEPDSNWVWITARRNETKLTFPLTPENCLHLSTLLLDAGKHSPSEK